MEAGVTQAQPETGPATRSAGRDVHVDPRVERSRAVITSAATDLLMQGGVHAVTVDAVIARSGVARSTIYRHFPASTDLLAAVREKSVDQAKPMMTSESDRIDSSATSQSTWVRRLVRDKR